jgi:hypothetical protein
VCSLQPLSEPLVSTSVYCGCQVLPGHACLPSSWHLHCLGEESDKFAIGYSKEGGRIYRHKKTSLAPAKGQSALLPGSPTKPAYVYIPGWVNGRDAMVVSSLLQELRKKSSQDVLGQDDQVQFFPLVMEALVGWHDDDAAPVVSKLAMPARMLRNRPHIASRGSVWF